MESGAKFSECGLYRYSLWRVWDNSKPMYTFIGLNPSTADHINDDPTITRCINFTKSWGGGGLYMVNLFAFRATNPDEMRRHVDPIGPLNNQYLLELANQSDKVVACWGNHGVHLNRSAQVSAMLKKLHCLDTNKSGEPKHPLYIKSSMLLKQFNF